MKTPVAIVRVVAAIVVLSCLVPAGHGKRIISYSNSWNDTRIIWEQTVRLGSPFQGDLYYWWGDDEPFPADYDLMTHQSGVPVTGEHSGFPMLGTPVPSCMAVSDGPLPVLLPEAQEAAAAGKWPSFVEKSEDQDILAQAQAVRRHYEKMQLRTGARKAAGAGARGKPAIVYVTMTTASEEEVNFPAFAQEMLGDVVSRGVRRIAGALELKFMLEDGRAVGVPESLGGVSLETALAELGQKDGSELRLTGVSAFESTWPQYERIQLPLEAFLADQVWPPCENLGREDPVNHYPVGSSLKVGVGPEEDNDPSNVVVIVTDDRRVCVNKHALSNHIASQSTEPGLPSLPCPLSLYLLACLIFLSQLEVCRPCCRVSWCASAQCACVCVIFCIRMHVRVRVRVHVHVRVRVRVRVRVCVCACA